MNQLTLEQFQSSSGIRLEEQIILLNNPLVFDGFEPVIKASFGHKFTSRLDSLIGRITGFNYFPRISIPDFSDRLFLGHFDRSIDHIEPALHRLFKKVAEMPQRQFEVILGKGDYSIDSATVDEMPENVSVFWANNVNTEHRKVRYLPMGRDFRNSEFIEEQAPGHEKTILCYCNFSLNTHPVRDQLFKSIKSKKFLTFEHMGNFLEYSISRREFLKRLSESKFAICPRGNAIDTFRLWDCLYLGTIPIVVREATFHNDLRDLPILFVDSVEEIAGLDERTLDQTYEEMLYRKFNYSKLKLDYWLPSLIN